MSIESRSRQYGKIAGHWQIREFLGSGSGGKSAVFRLVHTDSASVESALKVVNLIEKRGKLDNFTESRKAEYERVKQKSKDFAEQEVLLMNKLQGRTNIVTYSDHTFVDWADETGFGCDLLIRMELLTDLRSEIETGRKFDQDEILKISKDICTALVLCHGKSILHRDIKPENIFYNEDGNYKLGDFGVSRILSAAPMAKASTSVCTPEYAAPEQMTGKYDKRVDIYSLGLVLYELSNNNLLPFATSSYISDIEMQKRMLNTPLPAPCNASKALASVILKACAFHPEDRYQTAEDFLAELNDCAGVGSRPVGEASSVNRGTQKAVPATGMNATQFAGPDTGKRKDTRETVYANPEYKKYPAEAQQEESRKRIPKGIMAGIAAVLVIASVFFLREEHEHIWNDATCIAPRTCEECGETEGSAVGHSWLDATCENPSACAVCRQTEGVELGHQWLAATYQTPQVCSVCGATQGESLSAPWMTGPLHTSTGIIAVSPGGWATYALTERGRVYAIGRNQDGQADVSHWSGVTKIAAGDRHIAVLLEDGTVDAIGRKEQGQCKVQNWHDIIDVYAGSYCTVGICRDGTVMLAGQSPQVHFDVSDWTNIVQVAISDHFIVGLRTDGTVVYTGGNGHEDYDDCNRYDRNGNQEEITAWEDIVQIAVGDYHTLGLRTDGTVVATIPKNGEYIDACDVSDWENIIAIAAGKSFSVGLRKDGTVVVAGDFCDKDKISNWKGNTRTVRSWTDIIQIKAVYNQIIGLTEDGDIMACGFNSWGQCEGDKLRTKAAGGT